MECTSPKRKSCGPGVSPRKLQSRGPVVSMHDGPGNRVSGVTVPASRAIAAVTTLNVEPGG